MHFENSKLHKGQFIPEGYLRFLLITIRVEIHSPKIFCIKTSYYVSSASMMSKSSTSIARKALKLDDKVKVIYLCDGGKCCQAVAEKMCVGRTQIINILKRKRKILDNFENNVSSSTSCY